MDKIKAITKRPGMRPVSTWITPTLENLQKLVDGYIETVTLASDLVIICDEEGRLKGKEYNCTVSGVSFVGDIILVGRKGEEFADLPLDYQEVKHLFPGLWEGWRATP